MLIMPKSEDMDPKELRNMVQDVAVRVVADEAETMTGSKFWPFPTYGELLFA